MKFASKNGKSKSMSSAYKSESIACYLMILLPLIGFIVFNVYPILWTFRWSWFSYNGIDSQAIFVGWENFKTVFTTDTTYWKVWLTTLQYGILKVPIEMSLALFIAVLLNRQFKGAKMFQALFYLPNVVSVAIIGLIFSNMFSYWGVVNTYLVEWGIIQAEIDWFASKWTAMFMLVLGGVWNTFGVNVMYFLSALINVPEELYESAEIDGASKTRQFFSITIPMIAPVFQTILLLSLVGTLGVNDYILAFTGGGPSGQTLTVMSYLTRQFVPGFTDSTTPALGYGCAMSFMTTIILTTIALVYNKLSGKLKTVY
ncbi:MAG: sugar ABC transporter permease [Clostridia bacterium]|nr:sugar ABC transporter permease [Clostridia bacterium]